MITQTQQYFAGQRFEYRTNGEKTHIRVMAVVEGYVMARHKNSVPFVKSEKQFTEMLNKLNAI
jgi:hypothetical protein